MRLNVLRAGQRQAAERSVEKNRLQLSVRLPTGYGKTATAIACYAARRELGLVNRLLYIVSNTSQLTQFCNDARHEFVRIGAPCSGDVFDVGYGISQAMRRHNDGSGEVFVCTIQALNFGTLKFLQELMETGKWMVVIDEHHHYAFDKAWGRAIAGLRKAYLLAMSATPARLDAKDAFDEPEVIVTYVEAFDERAVKRLILHSYEYRVDAITLNGQTISFNTSELTDAAGGDSPEAIERYLADRKMRWSPKYISPIISIAIERLINKRLETGRPAQMIIHAMCVSHAQLICEQIATLNHYGLRVDWVGTGQNGRPDEENRRIITAFCPPKRNDGRRHPDDIKLDILISVGIAGEGLDSVFVTESILLFKAGLNNSTLQKIGRGARPLPNVLNWDHQVNTVIVDSSCPLAKYSGNRIMDVFDAMEPTEAGEGDADKQTRELSEYQPLPDEPHVALVDCTLESIDIGDPQVRNFAQEMESYARLKPGELFRHFEQNPDALEKFYDHYRGYLTRQSAQMNGMAALAQMRDQVALAGGKIARLAATRLRARGHTKEFRELLGACNKQINGMKKRVTRGVPDADITDLEKQYAWLKSLERALLQDDMPSWLVG